MKWKFATGSFVNSAPVIGSDGTIYIGSDDDNLYALNQDGSEKWSFHTGGFVQNASPALGTDGTIYFGSEDGNVYRSTRTDPRSGVTKLVSA